MERETGIVEKTKDTPSPDLKISDFWTETYLPHTLKQKKKSTQVQYVHIWHKFLKDHFGDATLRSCSTSQGTELITKLCDDGYADWSLANVRTVASGIFAHAIATGAAGKGAITDNPWMGVKNLARQRKKPNTKAYTIEQVNQMIHAFDHCTVLHQLPRTGAVSVPHAAPKHAHTEASVMLGLCFYLALRPHEAKALGWEDYVNGKMRINKGIVRGVLDTNKSEDDVQLIVIEPLAALLARLRKEQGNPETGYILMNKTKSGPIDFGNFYRRVMKPCLAEHGLEWSAMYAGRRGGGTTVIDLTGNLIAAQELLRHKDQGTTSRFYQTLTQNQLADGMKLFEDKARHV